MSDINTGDMSTDKEEETSEAREATRQRTLHGAKIIVDKTSIFDCVIKNRTKNGYGLQLGSTIGVPSIFTLHDEKVGVRHVVEVVWRKRDGLGVKIIDY